MSEGEDRMICIATPLGPGEAQTFVRAHMERLSGRLTAVWGRDFEHVEGGGSPVPAWRCLTGMFPGRRRSRIAEAVWRRGMARFLKRSGFAVLLAEFGMTGARLARACERAGVPLVVHFHGYDAYRADIVERFGEAYRQMFRTCAAVVAVSHAMVDQLQALGAPAEKVRVNPYGVDCAVFEAGDAAANPPLFVGVGRFVEKKAPHLTLLAFRRVLDACPEARLRLLGDGPLMPVCRDMVRGLGMEHAVELPGAVPHAEVAEAMRGARAFVQHSVRAADGDCEGNPVAVMEAGAAGLPVVATRHAGIPETVLDGTTGLLVDERDVDGMAERMIELARDPALAGRLGRAARERIRAEFGMEKSIERLGRILTEAAERR